MIKLRSILSLLAVLATLSGCCSYRVLWWHSEEPEAYAHRPTCADYRRWEAMPWCRGKCGQSDPQCELSRNGVSRCNALRLPPEAIP